MNELLEPSASPKPERGPLRAGTQAGAAGPPRSEFPYFCVTELSA